MAARGFRASLCAAVPSTRLLLDSDAYAPEEWNG
jgi:hypothetical protein